MHTSLPASSARAVRGGKLAAGELPPPAKAAAKAAEEK